MAHFPRSVTAPAGSLRQQHDNRTKQGGGALERFIALELSHEPFDLELHAASFSYMTKEELAEILDKILETISPEKMESIYIAEDKTHQIMDFLQILRYQFDNQFSDSDKLQKGIEEADTVVLIPLMAWLLANMSTLKTRAYLSKFLVKVKIPDEMLCDDDVMALFDEYETEIEEFKRVHKRRELMIQKRPLADVKGDTEMIHQDLDCLKRKIDLAKAKVSRCENVDEIVELIQALRIERQKQNDLIDQEGIESSRVQHIATKMEYLRNLFSDLRTSNQTLTPTTLIDREIQEVGNVRQLVTDELPKSISKVRRKLRSLKLVLQHPRNNIKDLEEMRRKIYALKEESKQLEQNLEGIVAKDSTKEVKILKKKVEFLNSKREKLGDDLKTLENECDVAKTKLTFKSFEVLAKRQKEEDYDIFIKNLRSKAKVYKEKKGELNIIRAQNANLYRTHQKLDKDLGKSKQSIVELEKSRELGDGYADLWKKSYQASLECTQMDEGKRKSLAHYSENITTLNNEIEERKHRLKPLFQMVNSQRQNMLMVSMEHRQMKHKYEQATIDDKILEIGVESGNICQQIQEMEIEILKTDMKNKFNQLELTRANEEPNNNSYERSFKEKLLGQIVEQERIHRQVIREEGDLARTEQECRDQQQLFANLIRLLKAKKNMMGLSENREEFPL